jgi:cytidine deaminase
MRSITDDDERLLRGARRAAQAAYCPYSSFPVGAVVETELGQFTGCNVENASYSLGICAERVAIHCAVAAGATLFSRLAVSCVKAGEANGRGSRMPCGACRQVIAEFMAADAEIVVDGAGVWSVRELLPDAFLLPAAGRHPADILPRR